MNETTSQAGAELLEAIGQMQRGERARVYTPEQVLAISARRSTKRTPSVNKPEAVGESPRFDQGSEV
ncbi:MAG: hypothetical protein OXI59_22340 [Gemmatimonadota bacterium]|nr:hypothetical protein [Gemmatimonadota bacterium]